jgi:hypothetical protein
MASKMPIRIMIEPANVTPPIAQPETGASRVE